MNKTFSHAACAHPSTKVARAACRRAMKAAAAVEIANPILAAVEAAMTGPKMLTAGTVVIVTRENWREFKGQTVVATLTGERVVEGTVTGWSERLLQIKAAKLVRIPADEIVTVVAG